MVAHAPPGWRPARLAEALARFRHQRVHAPLTFRTAWHSDKTSQLRVVQAFAAYKVLIIGGGNRSGKTWILMQTTAALIVGSDHPHAAMYWRRHGVDPSSLPAGPSEGAFFALSSNASIKNHRRQVEAMFPPGACRWHNRDNKGEAYVEIECPGYDRTARIFFLSDDQGEDVFQGAEWRAVFVDEEGSQKIWGEALARVASLDGWVAMANTPLKGRTWVYWRYVAERPPRSVYMTINPADNPYLPRTALDVLANADKARARLYGEWEEVQGAVYPEWSRDVHVVDRLRWRELYPDIPWPDDGWPVLPPEWPRYRAMDFGAANPCVVLWCARDTHGRRLYYREAYHAGHPIASWWAPLIRTAEGQVNDGPRDWTGLPPDRLATRGWADPAGAQEIRDLRSAGVHFAKANKAITAGISRVRQGLRNREILVLDGACPKLVAEIERYQWQEQKGDEKNAKEIPLKRDDHAVDCLRYGEVGIARYHRLETIAGEDEGE